MDFLIFLAIIAVIAVMVIGIYNRIVALKHNRKNAYSDIDVQLKQRFDLIPKLVETVKGYAEHESRTFENITQARASVDNAQSEGERIKAESMLGGALMGLFAVAENYPDLKADKNFQQLMTELSDIENKIAAARRFFNNATNEYNTAIQQFPANVLAGLFHFQTEEYYELDDREAQAIQQGPEVKF